LSEGVLKLFVTFEVLIWSFITAGHEMHKLQTFDSQSFPCVTKCIVSSSFLLTDLILSVYMSRIVFNGDKVKGINYRRIVSIIDQFNKYKNKHSAIRTVLSLSGNNVVFFSGQNCLERDLNFH
jgi:hypothetical protein